MKPKQFIQRLQGRGVVVDATRGKGGHYRLELNGRFSVVKGHGNKDLSPTYMKLVCKQLGIDPDDII